MKTAPLAPSQACENLIFVRSRLVKLLGDLAAASLLSQIVYWHEPSSKTGATKLRVMSAGHRWIAKTREQWMDECGLTEWKFRRSMKILLDRGLIEKIVKKFNGDPTIHVRLLKDPFSHFDLEETSNLIFMKPPESFGGNLKVNIDEASKTLTKPTPEGTSEITTVGGQEHPPENGKQETAKTAAEISKGRKKAKNEANNEANNSATCEKGKKSLANHWRARLVDAGVKFIQPLSAKDLGMFKRLNADLGDKAIPAIDFAFANWWKFSQKAKAQDGLDNVPTTPQLWFVLKYRQILADLYLQSIAPKVDPFANLIAPAPSLAVSKPVQAEEPYRPTDEEIAAILALFD